MASRFGRIFLSNSTEKVRRADHCVSKMFWYGRKTMVKRVLSRFLVKNFLSHSAEEIREGNPGV